MFSKIFKKRFSKGWKFDPSDAVTYTGIVTYCHGSKISFIGNLKYKGKPVVDEHGNSIGEVFVPKPLNMEQRVKIRGPLDEDEVQTNKKGYACYRTEPGRVTVTDPYTRKANRQTVLVLVFLAVIILVGLPLVSWYNKVRWQRIKEQETVSQVAPSAERTRYASSSYEKLHEGATYVSDENGLSYRLIPRLESVPDTIYVSEKWVKQEPYLDIGFNPGSIMYALGIKYGRETSMFGALNNGKTPEGIFVKVDISTNPQFSNLTFWVDGIPLDLPYSAGGFRFRLPKNVKELPKEWSFTVYKFGDSNEELKLADFDVKNFVITHVNGNPIPDKLPGGYPYFDFVKKGGEAYLSKDFEVFIGLDYSSPGSIEFFNEVYSRKRSFSLYSDDNLLSFGVRDYSIGTIVGEGEINRGEGFNINKVKPISLPALGQLKLVEHYPGNTKVIYLIAR